MCPETTVFMYCFAENSHRGFMYLDTDNVNSSMGINRKYIDTKHRRSVKIVEARNCHKRICHVSYKICFQFLLCVENYVDLVPFVFEPEDITLL